MNSQMTEKEFKQRKDAIEVCGKNRGPHDYIPVSWVRSATADHVTKMICRICFTHVHMKTLYENYPEATL
jgi:hypothetical protein